MPIVHRVRAKAACAVIVATVSLCGTAKAQGMPTTGLTGQVSQSRLMGRIQRLQDFGTRHSYSPESREVGAWIAEQFESWGYDVTLEPVPWFGQTWHNVIATRRGTRTPEKVYVLGAHYDSQAGTRFQAEEVAPGADDNASGMAGVLEAAEVFRSRVFSSSVQFIGFVGEEQMLRGSLIHANRLPDGNGVQAAIILEMIGFTGPTQQSVPGCPDPPEGGGDFLGVLADERSEPLMKQYLATSARAVPELEVIGCVNPVVARSDHFPFWQVEIPALMLTDTANFRNPHYHTPSDTVDTLDPVFATAATRSAIAILGELAGVEPELGPPSGTASVMSGALLLAVGAWLLSRPSLGNGRQKHGHISVRPELVEGRGCARRSHRRPSTGLRQAQAGRSGRTGTKPDGGGGSKDLGRGDARFRRTSPDAPPRPDET